MKKIILLLISITFLSGCYNYREINDLAIASALGIEKKDDTYNLYLQVINTSSFDPQNKINESPVVIYEGKGKNLYDALTNINTKLPKKIFTHHLKILILDKSVFNDLDNIINFLMNNVEINLNLPVATSLEHSPKEVLEIITPGERINSIEISKLLKNNEEALGIAYNVSIKNFFQDYLNNIERNILSNIKIEDKNENEDNIDENKRSTDNTKLLINELVVFNKKNLIVLNEEEALTLNLLHNKVTNAEITMKCDGGYFSVQTIKTKIKPKEFKDNNIYVKGLLNVSINDYSCNYDVTKKESLKKLKKIIQKNINKNIINLKEKSVKEEIDFIGINDYIKKEDKFYYDKYKNRWYKDALPNINIKNDLEINILKEGNLKGDIKR